MKDKKKHKCQCNSSSESHAYSNCRCTETRLYRRDGELVWLCLDCVMPYDVRVFHVDNSEGVL